MSTENTTTDTSPATPASEADDTRAALWREMQAQDASKSEASSSDEDRAHAEADADEPAHSEQPPAEQDAAPPAKAAGATQAQPTEDPWAGVPEPLRQEHVALKQNFDRLRGQISRQDRELAAVRARSASAQAPAQRQDGSAEKRLDDLKKHREKAREEYPELVQLFDPIIDQMESQLSAVTQDVTQMKARSTAEEFKKQGEILLGEHSDYEQILSDQTLAPKLIAFVQSPDSPAWVHEVARKNMGEYVVDGAGMARLMTAFKQHVGIGAAQPTPNPPQPGQGATRQSQPQLSDRRKRQLEGAASVPSRSSGRPTVSGIPENASREEMWKAIVAQGQ